MDILVADIVDTDFLAVDPDTPVEDAISLMHTRRSSSVVVVENGDPVGILTERDAVSLLLESFEGAAWKGLPVRHIMTSPVIAVCDDCTILEALAIARGGKIRHVPVINTGGELAGVLNQGDMVQAMYRYYKDGF